MTRHVDLAKMKAAIEAFERGELTEGAVLSKIMSETNKFRKRMSTRLAPRPLEVRMGCARAVCGSRTPAKK